MTYMRHVDNAWTSTSCFTEQLMQNRNNLLNSNLSINIIITISRLQSRRIPAFHILPRLVLISESQAGRAEHPVTLILRCTQHIVGTDDLVEQAMGRRIQSIDIEWLIGGFPQDVSNPSELLFFEYTVLKTHQIISPSYYMHSPSLQITSIDSVCRSAVTG